MEVCSPAPLPHTTQPPGISVSPGDTQSLSPRLWPVGPQALRPRVPAPAGSALPTVSWSATGLLTIVRVRHCLPHGEDHGQDEGGITEFLVVWGGKAGSQSPSGWWEPPQRAGNSPRLTLRVCLHVPCQLHRQHR